MCILFSGSCKLALGVSGDWIQTISIRNNSPIDKNGSLSLMGSNNESRFLFLSFNTNEIYLPKQLQDSGPRHVVGRLQEGWVVQDRGDVWLMFPPRLRETILYERLMTSHVMPCERMAEPVVVWPGLLSEEEAETAVKMFTNTRKCPAQVTDRRVTHNGFMLGLYHVAGQDGDDTGSFTLRLEGTCPLLSNYNVSDLRELLGLVNRCREDSVRRTRPSKVREYLTKEATRLAGTMAVGEMDSQAVEEMMVSRREVLGTSVVSCIHGKPLMKLICATDDE